MNPTQALLKAIDELSAGSTSCGVRLSDFVTGWSMRSPVSPDRPLHHSGRHRSTKPSRRRIEWPLIPDDERAVVEELDGRRDQLLADPSRTQPVIVFLQRDGDGRVALAKAPGLSGWVRGGDVDPERIAEVDVTVDRARFEAEVGRGVEDWLAAWRADMIPRDGESFARAYWAALLERP
jgi:hypothetical protein